MEKVRRKVLHNKESVVKKVRKNQRRPKRKRNQINKQLNLFKKL